MYDTQPNEGETMTTRASKWDRRFAARGIVDLEARVEHEAAVQAEHEAEENPVCPIDGEPRDPRLKYCSAECCAEDENTDLSPTGAAGDRRPCSLCSTPGARLKGRNPYRFFCDEGCAALANCLDATSRTPSAEQLRRARLRAEAARAAAEAKKAADRFDMAGFANALLGGIAGVGR